MWQIFFQAVATSHRVRIKTHWGAGILRHVLMDRDKTETHCRLRAERSYRFKGQRADSSVGKRRAVVRDSVGCDLCGCM